MYMPLTVTFTVFTKFWHHFYQQQQQSKQHANAI
jgi:hypothetical protein